MEYCSPIQIHQSYEKDSSYRKGRTNSKSSNQSCLPNYSSFTTTSVLKEKSLKDSIVFLTIAIRNLTSAYTVEILSTLNRHRDLSAREKVNICLEARELTKRHHRICDLPHDEHQSQRRRHVEKAPERFLRRQRRVSRHP